MFEVKDRISAVENKEIIGTEKGQSSGDVKDLFGFASRKVYSIFDMLYEFDIARICRGKLYLIQLRNRVEDMLKDTHTPNVPNDEQEFMTESYKLIEYGLEPLDIGDIQERVANIRKLLEENKPLLKQVIFNAFMQLDSLVEFEMKGAKFYQLPRDDSKFVAPKIPDWFRNDFSDCIYDYEEAHKCLAFGRSTACAFHLIRIAEYGLKKLCTVIKPKNPTPGKLNFYTTWDAMIKELDRYSKGLDPKADKDELNNINLLVIQTTAMKNAWRNPTMHIERVYTEEEAKEVLGAINNLMKNLSDDLAFYV